jgi:hypothetical protein
MRCLRSGGLRSGLLVRVVSVMPVLADGVGLNAPYRYMYVLFICAQRIISCAVTVYLCPIFDICVFFITGQLSELNPACVLPALRKTLIQLLTELQMTGNDLKMRGRYRSEMRFFNTLMRDIFPLFSIFVLISHCIYITVSCVMFSCSCILQRRECYAAR